MLLKNYYVATTFLKLKVLGICKEYSSSTKGLDKTNFGDKV